MPIMPDFVAEYAVRVASNGRAALVTIGTWRPDVIVSDIEMPDEDGYELIRRVRRSEANRGASHVPAIALTASKIAM